MAICFNIIDTPSTIHYEQQKGLTNLQKSVRPSLIDPYSTALVRYQQLLDTIHKGEF